MRARAALAACGLAAAITFFGGWLRLAHLTTHPTWWDEHASLFSATGQLARQGDAFDGRVSSAASPLPKASVAQDGPMLRVGALLDLNRMSNVPGATLFWDRGNGLAFNLLLHFWVKMFGARDAALRSLPWLLGTLAIPAVFCVALQAGGGLAGATACALLASSNALLVEFSREVRPYSLAVLLGLAATSCLLALARPGASRWLAGAYVGALVALAFTHYLAAPVVFGAHALAALMSRNRLVLLGVVAAGVAATGAALLVWMLWGANLGMAAMAEHDRIWLDRAREGILWWLQPFHWPDALRLTVERPMQMNWPGLVFWPREHPVAGAAVALWLSAAAFGFWQWWRVNPSARGVSAAAILAISAGALFSLVLAWRSGHTLPFLNRYFIFYVPFQSLALGLALAGCLGAARRWNLSALAAVVLAAGLVPMLASNARAALRPEAKETFSFDSAAAQARPGSTVRCDSLDSALVFALKAGSAHRGTQIVVDPSCAIKLQVIHE